MPVCKVLRGHGQCLCNSAFVINKDHFLLFSVIHGRGGSNEHRDVRLSIIPPFNTKFRILAIVVSFIEDGFGNQVGDSIAVSYIDEGLKRTKGVCICSHFASSTRLRAKLLAGRSQHRASFDPQ